MEVDMAASVSVFSEALYHKTLSDRSHTTEDEGVLKKLYWREDSSCWSSHGTCQVQGLVLQVVSDHIGWE